MHESVSLEPVVWVLRVHPGAEGSYRRASDYDNAATVTLDDNGCATIRGLVFSERFTQALQRAVFNALAAVGVKECRWSRRKPGQPPREFKYKITTR